MRTVFRNSFLSATIFGSVIIMSSLIGLIGTLTTVIADLLYDRPDSQQILISELILIVLLGIWAGAHGAKPTKPDTWRNALSGGLIAGLLAGILVGAYAWLIGTIDAAGVNMRTYLPQMSPQSIELFLFGRDPITAFLIYVGILSASGLFGGLLARAIGRGRIPAAYRRLITSVRNAWESTTLYRRIAAFSYTQYVVLGVLLVLAMFLPLTMSRYWNFTFGTVGIYILMGLGINIVVGLAGLLDLGYVAFFAVGAYTLGLLTSPQQLANFQMNFWVAGTIGILMAALTGVILGFPVLRLRGDYLAIVTLGFGEIIRILIRSDMLSGFTGGPQGIRDIAGPSIFGYSLATDRGYMWMIILSIVLAIFVTIRLQESRVGRAWIAMREDETVAQAMGINTYFNKLIAFGIGAAFAGLGGVIFASRNQYVGPEDANFLVSINVLAVVIVGGMGSIPGVFLGAFVLKGLPEILRQLDDYRILAFSALLVVMMIVRPEGLWPSKRRRLEMHEDEIASSLIIEDDLNPPQPAPTEGSAQ
jgi:ABC-type branched-subunit amino acid transport system permease subunit